MIAELLRRDYSIPCYRMTLIIVARHSYPKVTRRKHDKSETEIKEKKKNKKRKIQSDLSRKVSIAWLVSLRLV